MKKCFAVIVVLFFSCTAKTYGQVAKYDSIVNIIKGNWVSLEDSLWEIKISGSQIIDFYKGEIPDTGSFEIMKLPCDSVYPPITENTLFLQVARRKAEVYCYEIYFDTNTLVLMPSYSGKTFVFGRK